MNQRPSGYEPDELTNCSTPRYIIVAELSAHIILPFYCAFVKCFLPLFLQLWKILNKKVLFSHFSASKLILYYIAIFRFYAIMKYYIEIFNEEF